MKKRLLAAAVCMALCLSLCGCARWWELLPSKDTPVAAPTETVTPAVIVTVEGGSAEVGDTVILPVTVSADAHIVNADVFLRYDPAVLEPVLQYDAATDSERYAEPGDFNGSVHSEKLEDGTVYVLLAAADNGVADKGTLFYVAFRLLSDTADSATVTPEIPVCRVRANGKDVDPAVAGTLTVKAGTVVAKQPTGTVTATNAAEGNG